MLKFDKGIGQYKNWIISEDKFHPEYLCKAESIMARGNGYLGLRAVYEEPYAGQTRGLFIAVTYNKDFRNEVTELPNAADFYEELLRNLYLPRPEESEIIDSSLSMAIHCITAIYSGDIGAAYSCFKEVCLIDIGSNPHSSDTGIHAASLGGIWIAAVFGFGGVFNNEGQLELDPVLPCE